MANEICFDAPEINMASDIVVDARVSVVTVAKLVDVKVTGACKCPTGGSAPVRRAAPSSNNYGDRSNFADGGRSPITYFG